MRKVVKFGGSSLASAQQFQKVGDIIRSDASRRFVVPSAPGKRSPEDIKVTDMLYDCYETAAAGKDFSEKLTAIKKRYYEIIQGLELSLSLEEEFQTIEKDFAGGAGEDYAASRGEFLNGKIMAAYLGYEFVDPAEGICFDENGAFLAAETQEKMGERLSDCENAVVPGFYGAKDRCVRIFGDRSQDCDRSGGDRDHHVSGVERVVLHGGHGSPRGSDFPCAQGGHPH